MKLLPQHLEMLKNSGLSEAVIEARGYYSTYNKTELKGLGFTNTQLQTVTAENPALVIPVYRAGNSAPVFHQLRPDQPRTKDGKAVKYETPKGVQMVVDIPPPAMAWIGDPQRALYITEGTKKADAGVSHGLCCVSLLGVWNFRGTNAYGGRTALGDWEAFALNNERPVYIVFDSDVVHKPDVHKAMVRLRGLLEARGAADVRFVYLEPGKGGAKVGLDDFLTTVKKGQAQYELQLLSVPDPKPIKSEEEDPADPDAADRRQYQYATGGTWWYKGPGERIRLVNGHFKLCGDVVQDDGTDERVRVFELEGYLDQNGNSKHPRRFHVRADRFDGMDWVREHFGAGAILYPGANTKERLRHAIQLLSGEIEERVAYTHLGWRQIDGQWCYLHAAGAIGALGPLDGVCAEVPAMSHYALPDPPEGEELRQAVRRSLAFLDISHRAETWPLLAAMYTAPLAGLLPADFVLWLQGETGGRKSSAAKLALNHFGQFSRTVPFPSNFDSTPNAVEYSLFLAKDAPDVIDDYNPAGSLKEQQKRDAVAERILSAMGDHRTRDRLTQDGKKVSSKVPRCMAIVTAESEPPGAQSRIARAFVTDWTKAGVRLDRLTKAQAEDTGQYALAMAGYLQHLAGKYEHLKRVLPTEVRRQAERVPPSHGRIQEAAAKLYIGVAGFLTFAVQVGAIDDAQRQQLLSEARQVFYHYAERTGTAQAERKPALLFVDYLRAMLVKGKAYLADRKTGACPDEVPGRWGWQPARGNDTEPLPKPGAERIGWVDLQAGRIYLDSTVAHEMISGYSQKAGVLLTITKRSMGEALDREGLLKERYTDRWETNVRAEGLKHWCWAFGLELLPGLEDDDDGDIPDPFPPDAPDMPPPHGEPPPAPSVPAGGVHALPESQRAPGISGGTGGSGGTTPNSGPESIRTGTEDCLQNCLQNHLILEAPIGGSPVVEGSASRSASGSAETLEAFSGAESLTLTHAAGAETGVSGAVPPCLQKETHTPPPSARRERITERAEMPAVMEALASQPVVGLDIETTGLNPRRDRMRLLQLSIPGRTFLIDCAEVDPRPLFPVLADRTLTGHYLQFDLGFLWRLGFEPGKVDCTMLLAQLLGASGSDRPKGYYGLAEVCKRHLGLGLEKELQKSDWTRELSDAQWEYAARDAEVLLPLREQLLAELSGAGLDTVAQIESRCLPTVVWMSAMGVPFDVESWTALATQAQEEAARFRAELDAIAPEAPELLSLGNGWKWDSPAIVTRVFELLGIKLKNTGDDTLAAVDHPVADLLRQYREAAGRVSRYGANWLEYVHEGRLYTDWKQLGSRAGRMSNGDPCVQQAPRDKRYRRCIAAPAGRVLVKADYSQIELRIAARIANDRRMQETYRDGGDLHRLTARLLLGRDFADEEEAKVYRQYAKAVNFGFLFGMGWETFIGYALNNYGVRFTPEQAQNYRRTWLRNLSGINAWHKRQSREAIETRTLAGRRRTDVSFFTQKLNSPVQGTGADGLKRALALLWKRRAEVPGAFPVIACHDEIVAECDADQAPAVAAWLERAMLDGMAPLIDPIPVVIEPQIGRTWAG